MTPVRLASIALAIAAFSIASPGFAAAPTNVGNRLTYLDSDDPFYPHRDFPKLITPQWVGEAGVEAVVILAIDDMRDSKKYETFLRPILERLKKIDGRAPVSIMVNTVTTNDAPQLQAWLKEGLSLEVHTLAHPCPLLQKGSFTNAANTYHGGVDLLASVPGNKPVAFRMPCCDSMNSPSPRFYAEMFNRTSSAGNFLTIDSSVMCLLTDAFLESARTSSPSPLGGERAGVRGDSKQPPAAGATPHPQSLSPQRGEGGRPAAGVERFRKYFPAQTNAVTKKSLANFGTWIEDYPYPYVINKVCWEFPAMVPSDWEAFNLHGSTNPITLADWKAALDAVVRKQGVFTWIFHPHGWSSAAQIIEFIDHTERTHGKKVKFLTFKEAQERLDTNLLKGNPLRAPHGTDFGVRLLDLDNDGYMDVVIGNSLRQLTRVWQPKVVLWRETGLPFTNTLVKLVGTPSAGASSSVRRVIASAWSLDAGIRFGVLRTDGHASAMFNDGLTNGTWHFDDNEWRRNDGFWKGLPVGDDQIITAANFGYRAGERTPDGNTIAGNFPLDRGVRFRDMDHDGICELIVADYYPRSGKPEPLRAIFQWSEKDKSWWRLGAGWPKDVALVQYGGQDNGVRFADVNGDGFEDLLVSNEQGFSLHLYINTPRGNLGWAKGWTYKIRDGKRAGAPSTASAPTNAPNQRAESVLGAPRAIPPFVRAGAQRNNGAWFHRGQLFVQNEDTAHLPDNVQRIPFRDLLTGDEPPPKSPAESQAAFSVRPGFKVELVASEPLVIDPVAFEWGADGRLWVVEMHDYPSGVPDPLTRPLATLSPTRGEGGVGGASANGARGATRPTMRPGGRVIFLEDTDGDGRYDKRTVFLDGLNFPNGVMPWRKGVLVSAAPEVFYAEDTDGDGKADLKKVLFTGFREGNQQHRVNGFEYGLDGWVYAANGDSGGVIQRVGGVLNSQPSTLNSAPIDIRGHDIRFKPDTGEIELVAGQTQFGRRRDDWGNWFGNNNPNWLWHYHIPIHYLKRNPQLVVKSTRTMLANYSPPNQVFTVGARQQRFNWPDRINEVTSANSPCPYRDDLFGPDFATSVFISEPANNVVHREVLEPDGVTFKSRRAPDEQDREFLASADNWFRPTMLKTGPDGALYIADMYRLIIEHPEYFPEELKNRPDMRDGDDKGRIWRVVPEGKALRKVPNLMMTHEHLWVSAPRLLQSPNGWQRDTVQRLLVERGQSNALQILEQVFHASWSHSEKGIARNFHQPINYTTGSGARYDSAPATKMTGDIEARVRLQAFLTVSQLRGMTPSLLSIALQDPHPMVRLHAIRVCEEFLPGDGPTGEASVWARIGPRDGSRAFTRQHVIAALLKLAEDGDTGVRCQLAFTLGEWRDPRAGKALVTLAMRDFGDIHLQAAIMSSAAPHVGTMLSVVFATPEKAVPSGLVEQLLSLATALGDQNAIADPLVRIGTPENGQFAPWQFAALSGLIEALDRRSTSLTKFQTAASAELKQTLQNLDPLFTQARADASLQSAIRNPQSAIAATRLLARGPTEQDADLGRLIALLHPTSPPEVQQSAMASLKKLASPRVAELLLAKWNELMPAVRGEALSALLSRAEWTQSLLGAIEAGKLTSSALGLAQQQLLLAHTQPAIRERAAKLFTRVNPDRAKVIERFKDVETLTGNAQRGGGVFGGLCGTCHRVGGGARGGVGPDLGTVADKPVAQLLTAILDPSQAVDPAYVYYIGYTKDFRDVSGIIVAETPNSITLRNAGGQDETVLRADLVELKTGGLSMMPEGLEANLSPQAMADLIAFIKSGAGAAPRRRE